MKFLQILILILGLAIFINAQKATLGGTIIDDQGSVIPKGKITLTNEAGKKVSTITDDNGNYKIEINEGLYKVKVTFVPLQNSVISEYFIAPYSKMQLDIALRCVGECKRVE